MKLLLTSNGLKNPELNQALREMTGGRTHLRIAIIPTAGDPIEWVPDSPGSNKSTAKLKYTPGYEVNPEESGYYKVWKNRTDEIAGEIITVSLRDDPEKVREQLQDVDVIDVGGGDINYLLYWAKKAKLDTYLKDLLDKGVLYIGASAGSMLLYPDIGLTWWDPIKSEGEDHIGFGIVDFIVAGHTKENEIEEKADEYIQRREYLQTVINFPWKIYVIQDGQAVKVVGDKVEAIGPGAKKIV